MERKTILAIVLIVMIIIGYLMIVDGTIKLKKETKVLDKKLFICKQSWDIMYSYYSECIDREVNWGNLSWSCIYSLNEFKEGKEYYHNLSISLAEEAVEYENKTMN